MVESTEEDNLSLFIDNFVSFLIANLTQPAPGYWTVSRSGNDVEVWWDMTGGGMSLTTGVNINSNGLDSSGNLSLSIDNLKINDIAQLSFTGKGGNSEIFLPELDELEPGGEGKLKVEFRV